VAGFFAYEGFLRELAILHVVHADIKANIILAADMTMIAIGHKGSFFMSPTYINPTVKIAILKMAAEKDQIEHAILESARPDKDPPRMGKIKIAIQITACYLR